MLAMPNAGDYVIFFISSSSKIWYIYNIYFFIDLSVFQICFYWVKVNKSVKPVEKFWANKRKFFNIYIYIFIIYYCIYIYLAEKVVKGLAMTASWLKTSPPSLVHLWLCQNTLGHVFNRPHTTAGILSKLTPARLSLFNYWSQEYFINIFVASDSDKFERERERMGKWEIEIRRYYTDSIVCSFYLPSNVFTLVW